MQATSNLPSVIAKLPQMYTDEQFEDQIHELANVGAGLAESFEALLPERHGHGGMLLAFRAIVKSSSNKAVTVEVRAGDLAAAVQELTRAIASGVRMNDSLASSVSEVMKSGYILRSELIRRKGRK